ncbi:MULTISPECIES: NAD-dependent epimerase/dehydratase family protein [unclassified Streptomyces]|uniref:NAD-dependent epimerase/dehydratase family protein n=1 Tax=unclassified Streptomyces TaxID=2593676 RepID=UPI00087C7848|nr:MULTISPECIES: NAD-dependent epimerase/dehydratase family protein [unclassified Streptomyces]REH25366.1 dTDP-glucose 4,6-dehydratase [Streptomyces sp. 2221.1]SDT81310.1 dTDP-glucose 4,6-dehydratase [Streptomyces sp. 2114.2]
MMPMAAFSPRGESRTPWGRVLVTGGAGFLGSHLCTRLLDAGAEVDCLDNLSTGRAEKVAHLAGRPGFRFLERDISAPGCADALTGPYDLVLHLAGPASPAARPDRPVEALDAGSLGTRTALSVAGRDGARFLLASSPPAGPGTRGDAPDDADPVGPHRACAEAVRFAEALVAAHAGANGSNAGIVRLYDGYGPGMRTDGAGTPAALIEAALTGRPVTVPGDGSGTYPLCYVDDMVDGVLLVAAGRSVRPVDIGGDEEPTAAEIARLVIELTGSDSPLAFVEDAGDGRPRPRPVTGFAREIFGWLPSVAWQDGLERTVAAFRDRPDPVPTATREPAGERMGEWWAQG